MSFIEARGLSHRFSDGTLALDRVDLEMERGEFVVITGRNGSGKTVLVRHLNGLLTPTEGTVRVDGLCVRAAPRAARRRIGMIFQDADSQIVGETVYEEVAFGPRNLGLAEDEVSRRVSAALQRLELGRLRHSDPHRLSGGEKRRLTIAGVLVMDPEVLIFDEPVATLDYLGVVEVLRSIVELHERGHIVVLITHDLARVARHATRLIVMDAGRIALDGTPEEVLPHVERFAVRRPAATESLSWLR